MGSLIPLRRPPELKVAWLSQRSPVSRIGTENLLPITLTLACRIFVCLGMSSAGISNRITHASSRWALVRDMITILLENHLVLMGLESGMHVLCSRNSKRKSTNLRSSIVRKVMHVPNGDINNSERGKGAHQYRHGRDSVNRFMLVPSRIKRILKIVAMGPLCVLWILSSWGDFVFQKETQGLLPTLWVVAPGLKNPSLHAGVQLNNYHDIFIGGLVNSCVGLAAGIVYVVALHCLPGRSYYCSKKRVGIGPNQGARAYHGICTSTRMFRQSHLVCGNIVLLVVLFCAGAWAPLTNLMYCLFGILILTPPGGASLGRNDVVPRRIGGGSENDATSTNSHKTTILPNVILVVHESLSGAAMESARGRDAAPFYHSLKSNPNVYQFQSARTVAGTTTIATPALLTGLAPYTDEGVKLIKSASLASNFKALGYATGSFVSYGADYTGSTWGILTDLFMPGFDVVVDPKATGEPLVNEYGMDDRKLTGTYFRRWLEARGTQTETISKINGTNDTELLSQVIGTSNTTTGPREAQNQASKPFFAVIVMNNNHFPHLRHATYSGDPKCDKEVRGDDNTTATATTRRAEHQDDQFQTGTDDLYGEAGYPGWDVILDSCGYDAQSRYFSSIRTADESFESIFKALAEIDELNNTIVMGAGDHGEVPGTMLRMDDINAPILSIPLWMHIPVQLLPSRAFVKGNNDENVGNTLDGHSKTDTFLNANIDRAVSILDIVPTLRDILGHELYTPNEEKECFTGKSLLSEHLREDRILPSWQGRPLQAQQIGIFSTKSEALLYYRKDPSKSRVVDFAFSDDDPFHSASESKLSNDTALGKKWKDMLHSQGYLNHSCVNKWMSDLTQVLDG